jgi:hypothetical protein
MEWVAGRDLATVLERYGPVPPLEVAWIGAQTARALAAAHATGIVHRDVKPANLLLTRGPAAGRETAGDGLVKLADFGIAVPATPWPSAIGPVDTGPLMGTTAYVSPEQVMGRPAGPASDLYALGCTLYELLIGRPPFSGHDTAEVMRLHLAQDPVPPGRLRDGVPAGLERVILGLLTKDAAGRPADGREVAQMLEAFVVAHRAAGRRPETAARTSRPGSPGITGVAGGTAAPTARMTPPSPLADPPVPVEPVPVEPVPVEPAPQAGRVSRRQAVITAAVALAAVLVAVLAITVSANSHGRPEREPAPAAAAPTSTPRTGTPRARTRAHTAPGVRFTKPRGAEDKKSRDEKPASDGGGHQRDGGGKGHGGHGKGHK